MKLRYYLLTTLICLGGGSYFAFWKNGDPLAIVCFILAIFVFTAAQSKQLDDANCKEHP